jgi:1-deoxy-D-xylulose-5-phosphate reductoisomerase
MSDRPSSLRRIALLGATGSIGTSALKVIRHLKPALQVTGLAAGRQVDKLAAAAAEFTPSWVYATERERLAQCALPCGCRVLADEAALEEAVCAPDVDMVLCAIVGTAGLRPVLAAIEAGKTIALASKEVLVMAGNLVTAAARRNGVRLLPVDSEHCAIFQCLEGHPHESVKRLILTASGGPFRDRKDFDFRQVTVQQALAHPTWSMGRKITLDSATLMNKGLEMIEAGWLFGVGEERITVAIHPQSIVHSMVEYVDGSTLAQLGCPDMCLPIQYCLTYPARMPSITPSLDFTKRMELDFEPPDTERFPAIELARRVMREGGAMGAVFNAANEVAVDRFCKGELTFADIPFCVEKTLDHCHGTAADSLDRILAADREARAFAAKWTR